MNERHICFIGASGVGKSTYINALISDNSISIVPAGGVGPCTAQAIIVRYGERESFRAEYHSKDTILILLIGLAKIYETKADKGDKKKLNCIYNLISKNLYNQIENNFRGNGKKQSMLRNSHKKQANLLITGRQDDPPNIAYLIDSLYGIITGKLLFGINLEQQDIQRIRLIRALLEKGSIECTEGQLKNYKAHLNKHASGHLAPLIRSFEVRVKTDLLKNGISLIDLPGVGIEGDIYKKVTYRNLARADAIVLVVSPKGIGESEHRLMREAKIYDKILTTCRLNNFRQFNFMIVITRVDDIVNARYSHNKNKRKWQYLYDIYAESEKYVRNKFKELLKEELVKSNSNNGDISIVNQIIHNINIIPVAPVEFRKLCAQDPDDRPFITDANQSNIPMSRQLFLSHFSKTSTGDH